jgi:hypothetical protein
MNKETALSALRAILTILGSYLVGHSVFGHTVSDNLWQLLGGAAITIVSTVWGLTVKGTTVEQWQSILRSVFAALSGVLVALGVLNDQTAAAIAGLIPAIAAVLQGHLSRQTTKAMATGKAVADSKTGVVNKAAPKIGMIVMLLCFCAMVHGQSPFRPMPKPKSPTNRFFRTLVPLVDSFENVWRFTANISPVGYSFNGTYQALAGAEYGYQHTQWDATAQK